METLSTMPSPPNLNRLPGYFIADMPEGQYVENGLESVDSMTLRIHASLSEHIPT